MTAMLLVSRSPLTMTMPPGVQIAADPVFGMWDLRNGVNPADCGDSGTLLLADGQTGRRAGPGVSKSLGVLAHRPARCFAPSAGRGARMLGPSSRDPDPAVSAGKGGEGRCMARRIDDGVEGPKIEFVDVTFAEFVLSKQR